MAKFKCRFCENQGIEAYGTISKGDWAKPIKPNTKRVECENGHRWSVPKFEKEKSE